MNDAFDKQAGIEIAKEVANIEQAVTDICESDNSQRIAVCLAMIETNAELILCHAAKLVIGDSGPDARKALRELVSKE